MKHMKRLRILLPLMIVCMMVIGASPASAATESGILKDSATVKVVSEKVYELTDGVYEGEYVLKNTLTGWDNIKANVVLVKPDAKASFKAIVPGYYTPGSTNITRAQTAATWNDGADKWTMKGITAMIGEYNSAADTGSNPVIAAINGDFCLGGDPKLGGVWTNAPRGTVIMEGHQEMGHEKAAADEFFFGQKANGSLGIVQRISGQKDSYVEAICGGAYILRNGSVEQSLTDSEAARQRTGVALKINGETLMITIEAHKDADGKDVGGITVKQLAELMRSSGAYNGINMDGGGSTTMVTRRAGETQTTKRTTTDLSAYSGIDANGEREVGSALMLVLNENGTANASKSTGTNSIKMDKSTYLQGDPIKVTAASDVEDAWVGVYKKGQDPNAKDPETGKDLYKYLCWYYVARVSDAGTWSWENGIEYNLFEEAYFEGSIGLPGEYTTYLMAPRGNDGNFEILGQTDFEVKENPNAYSIFMDSREYNMGDAVNVTAAAPQGSDAWVGLYYADEPHDGSIGSLRWYWVSDYNGTATDILSAKIDLRNEALQPGEYKIVFFGDSGYTNVKDTLYFTLDQQYNIIYKYGDEVLNNVGPTTYSHNTIQQGAVNLPETVDKAGYTFLGWYDNPELTGDPVTAIPQGSTGDKTIYAKFDRHSYAVNFDTDGGSEVAGQTVYYRDLASKPAENPTKDDLYFLGWVTEKNGSVPFDFNQPITGATTIYAKWGAENGVVVEFDANGGSAVLTQVVAFGEKAVKPENPTRAGYAFDKWVKADGTAFDFAATVTEPVTLKAVWKPVTYTITFNANGGSAVANKTYTVETAAFNLPTPTREGYAFKGWKDAAGKSYTSIAKGTTGNLALTAQWERVTSVTTDKDTYVMGEGINVNAYTDASGAWVGLYKAGERPDASGGTVSYCWEYVDGEYKGESFNILLHNSQKPVSPGNYVIHLIDGNWGVLASKNITIKENPNPAKGTLNLSGFSRDDKVYSGKSKSDHGKVLHEFFYGDGIFVTPTVSGSGVDSAWVGILSDDDYANGNTKGFIGKNWFYISDLKGQTVNLNYVADSAIVEGADKLPFGLNYWVVLVSDSGTILDATAFNYRTYNMDWHGTVWSETATKNLLVETEWSSRLANGTEQKPAVTIKRVNGHFGLTRDGNGKLVEITEEVLKAGKDYTIQYPASSKDIGNYKINISFPSSGAEYNYLSTAPAKYGLQDGIPYYLTSSANDHVIQYILNGGVNHEDNPALYQTGTAIKLKAPAKAGFVFGGWYTTEDFKDGTMIETIPASATSEFTLYAKWISEDDASYKIQYVLNGGDNNPNNPIGYTGITDITLRPAKKAGCTFDGWFFDSAYTKPADTIAKGTTGELTLYAKFTKTASNKVTITTSVKGGSISSDATGKVGDSFTVTYKPNNGYVLFSVTVDGVAVDKTKFASSYTFENVTDDHEIAVVYKVKLGKVTMKSIKTGNGKVQITWNSVKRAKEYKVYRSTNNKTYKLIGTTDKLKYIDETVKGGTKYYYKVSAYANTVTGTKSASKSIKAAKALPKVKVKSVIAKNGKITAKWNKVANAAAYNVYRSADGGKTYKLVVTTKKLSHTTKVLTAKQYKYKITTVKNGFTGKMSDVKTVTVLAQTKGLKVTTKKKAVTLTWDKTKNAAKYAVFKSVDGGKTYKRVLLTAKTTATFKNQKAGKAYYKVRAVKGSSYGKFTAVKTVKLK